MINLTEMDSRYQGYVARVERVNREGWMREASEPTGSSRTRGIATVIQQITGTIVLVVVVWCQAINGRLAAHRTDTPRRTAMQHAPRASS